MCIRDSANPCGIAVGTDIADAHAKAHACDPLSAYGGVIAANRTLTVAAAEQIAPIFTEVVLAPDFEPGALEILQKKKNLRVLKVERASQQGVEQRAISGGLLVQASDHIDAGGVYSDNGTLATGEAADAGTLAKHG